VTRLGRAYAGWLGPAQSHGPGWAQPVKKGIISKKIYEFSENFLYCILINSGLYFYIVKIQI
jgi:hypothetical protein